GLVVAEARGGAAPVPLLRIRLTFGNRNRLPPLHEPRARPAHRDACREFPQIRGSLGQVRDRGGDGGDGSVLVRLIPRPSRPRNNHVVEKCFRFIMHGVMSVSSATFCSAWIT